MLPITDTHQHLWQLEMLSLPWLSSLPALNHDFAISDYQRASQGLGIQRSVYVEVDVATEQRWREVELVAELCARPELPVCAIVAAADPLSDDFEQYLERLLQVPYVRGVRRVLHTPATPTGHCLLPRFVDGVLRIGQQGLSFDLCVRNTELGDAARLAELCPQTHFILDHCGNADPVQVDEQSSALVRGMGKGEVEPWARGISALAQLPNTSCKLSGIVASLPKEIALPRLAAAINHCIDTFGPSRVMFGSDWPVCTLRATLAEWLGTLREIIAARSLSEQRAILNDNAVRVYRLE